ncbi:MAG: hypothetical protein IKY16_03835 [Bacteroidales bacterium]|nr:hypothetical protein [Bacteroidales bacterium]
MNKVLEACTVDMRAVADGGAMTLDMQVRAYDLLSYLLEMQEYGMPSGLADDIVGGFCAEYEASSGKLQNAFDEDMLKKEAQARLEDLKKAQNEARFEAAAAASLHEFAKEVFQTWQTAGIFARRRALRELRERAGFRLESHRIGNYVAKTFDLMNEAHARFARAQQAVFSADVSYKVSRGVYDELFQCLVR